jgi:HEPN domain-containing protein
MSVSGNLQIGRIWLQTAHEDIGSARMLRDAGSHAASCFYAQQAAEKALKALWHVVDQEPWGHSVVQLLNDFSERRTLPADAWGECARALDQFYIPTRYPDSLPGITPGQAYGAADSERALRCANVILTGCDDWLAAR